MTIAVVAEKPAVARDIAEVVGASVPGEGYFHGNGYAVTWAVGHLVALAQPHEMNPAWKSWRRDRLPMLPEDWNLVVLERTRRQFEIVRKVMNARTVERVVCATDAGREGELIFRYIYELSGCTRPVDRLWISSLTPAAIREGFRTLKAGKAYERLAEAARGRSRADWLVGMNLSRAYSLSCDDQLSVGRVQTPTLAMIVERELAIRAFVPEAFLEVVAAFTAGEGAEYEGTYFAGEKVPPDALAKRLPPDGGVARAVIERARAGEARVESVEGELRRLPPPLLYDLTELQRHANRLFGWSAQRTLDVAQTLYETKKLVSYPRTDSRHLSRDVAATLGDVVSAISAPYRDSLAEGTGKRALHARFVNDANVTDHHAIVPTSTAPERVSLSTDERRLYDLVCRRLLSAWHRDHAYRVTTVITIVGSGVGPDRYHSSGTAVVDLGWKILDVSGTQREGSFDVLLPAQLEAGVPVAVTDARSIPRKTQPPRRFTEGTLLTAMESAGRTLDDREIAEAMRETGLGTPATRAATIEGLLGRGYLVRQGKSLEPTEKGLRLVAVVHPDVKSPAMTGQWEAKLEKIARGEGDLEAFMEGIERYVMDVVSRVCASEPVPATPSAASMPARATREPVGVDHLAGLLRSAFGFACFRPFQEAVCRAATLGEDLLLVMPTGAGKSLCYQLPGIARAGTTLVISPLIALMDDQASKLQALGLVAERVHSGRDRGGSRRAMADYAEGRLDFLFIAPERLSVPGFVEMLARRKPGLVAIDEAHCISHWGHDFRPEYRMIGKHLRHLRPAPVVALTATATPLVQDDIIAQLGLVRARRFIHGFRRTNLGIEIVPQTPSARSTVVESLLADARRRPAIVYAPTRREATELASTLGGGYPAAAYHAGLPGRERERVQAAFLRGDLAVVVATIAFGMGVDKANVRTVVHTALPGSVEAYYQEIGRAGRDGEPARAILLHSFIDVRTHQYFLDRDYPEVDVLERVFAELSARTVSKEWLGQRLADHAKLGRAEVLDKALEKLWLHGGAEIDPDDGVRRGDARWRDEYVEQRRHKLAQLAQMARYAEGKGCRMLHLVRHFGDQEDPGSPCGVCDVCAPSACVLGSSREPSAAERSALTTILSALSESDGQASGRLFRDLFAEGALDRRSFEHLLGALARGGLVRVAQESFEKSGERIDYERVWLAGPGRDAVQTKAFARVAVPLGRTERTAPGKRRRKTSKRAGRLPTSFDEAAPPAGIVDALKKWRLNEARRRQVPAFHVLSDRVLRAVASRTPTNPADLLDVPGIGPTLLAKYGAQILSVLRGATGRPPASAEDPPPSGRSVFRGGTPPRELRR